MIITKNAEWIYLTLAEAFEKETGKKWESYSRIHLKHSVSELEEIEKSIYGKIWLEVSHIEFEVETHNMEGNMFHLAAYPRTFQAFRDWFKAGSRLDSNKLFLKFFFESGYLISSDPLDETAYYQLNYQGQLIGDGNCDRNRSIDEQDEIFLKAFADHYEKS